ncbi:trans-1,2-dihydrobenzene-1,2-diol dehydrogenase-like [Diadema antillarum]|uniref:trans-1,2-dihydrobenzene-1,2-diol dehydrogenase-like n=1 Tax=Diadema antillarum TaxID=105358 RepID=UPI003A846780
MSKLRWGICSAGRISQDFATVLSQVENHKVGAVAARSEQDARRLAERVGCATAYEGYELLAADANIDIVYIGSIDTHHLPLCKLFLGAKKHVLCEKPLSLNAQEVQVILDCAKDSGCFFMEGIWSRFFPAYRKIKSLIDEGEIGDVQYIMGDFSQKVPDDFRVFIKSTGGSAINDIGVYLVQLAVMIFGPEPISVQGVGGLSATGVDDVCTWTMLYPGKKVASFTTCLRAMGQNEASIVGTEGRIRLPASFHCPTAVELSKGSPAGGKCEKKVFEFALPDSKGTFNYHNSAGFCYEAEAVKEAIDNGKTEHPIVPWSESLAIRKIMDKLHQDVGYVFTDEDAKAAGR